MRYSRTLLNTIHVINSAYIGAYFRDTCLMYFIIALDDNIFALSKIANE